MKHIVVVALILIIATSVMAAPKGDGWIPPGHRDNGQAGTSANASAIAGASAYQHQSQQQGQALVNQPNQTITVNGVPVTQGVSVTNPPVVVQEAQRQAPVTLPFINQAVPPYLQPPSETAQTRAPGVKPWNVAASHWKNDVWPIRLIKEPKSRSGIQVIKPTSGQQFPVGEKNLKRGAEPTLTIYKGAIKTKEWGEPHVIDRLVYKATSPDITLMQLQDCAMWDAVQAGATGLKVNQETYVLRSAQKGGDIRAMLGLSQLGSALGLPMLFGGGLEGGYVNYEAMMDAYPVLDVEQVQVQ